MIDTPLMCDVIPPRDYDIPDHLSIEECENLQIDRTALANNGIGRSRKFPQRHTTKNKHGAIKRKDRFPLDKDGNIVGCEVKCIKN